MNHGHFRLLPDSASSMAAPSDYLFWTWTALSAFIIFLIAGLILYFAVRYRRHNPGERPPATVTHNWMEIGWSVLPLGIFLFMFLWGTDLYLRLSRPPPDAMEIHVLGKQWMWKIQHPTGRREINELHVPLGRPIKLVMTSEDVIHDFFLPDFRVKQDVLPGRYTAQWFTATRLGEYHLFCSQYCGPQHAHMMGRVVVLSPADYQAWLASASTAEPPALAGEKLFAQYGCITCHGQRAPTLAGLYLSQVQLDDGRTVLADDSYLRQAILEPSTSIVAGYSPIMPSFRGQLSEEQLFQLIAYIKSLRHAQTQPASQPAPSLGHEDQPDRGPGSAGPS